MNDKEQTNTYKKITPSPNSVRDENFVSYRRVWLDSVLETFSPEMHGLLIDIGGKRENKRGTFRPPEEQTQAWWYINLDMQTSPNIFADVGAVPVKSNSVDVVICTEVLEHLKKPEKCIQEIHRILRAGGTAFASVPFMYPVHADPYDFQRFTSDGLRQLFVDFETIEIFPMGGYLGVMGMFIELGLAGIQGQQLQKKVTRRLATRLARWLYIRDLTAELQPKEWSKFTTGYFLRGIK